MTSLKTLTHKVAILPWQTLPDGAIQFLMHLPKPKRAGEEAQMKWGVARGTVAYQEGGIIQDIPSQDALAQIHPDNIENHADTALREAQEELGLFRAMLQVDKLQDHGLIPYLSENKPTYDLHVFSVPVAADFALEDASTYAQDSQKITWMTLEEIKAMAVHEGCANEQCKAGYVAIVQAVQDALSTP